MVVKQKNLRVFEIEIEDEVEFLNYINKNSIILEKFLLLLRGDITDSIINSLREKDVIFFNVNDISKNSSIYKSEKIVEEQEELIDKEIVKFDDKEVNKNIEIEESSKLIFNKTIRSGEEIVSDKDIVIFGRVNSGAKITTTANLEVFGKVDGILECMGEYLIAKEIGMGEVIFNGEMIENSVFDGKIKKISIENSLLSIKEL